MIEKYHDPMFFYPFLLLLIYHPKLPKSNLEIVLHSDDRKVCYRHILICFVGLLGMMKESQSIVICACIQISIYSHGIHAIPTLLAFLPRFLDLGISLEEEEGEAVWVYVSNRKQEGLFFNSSEM